MRTRNQAASRSATTEPIAAIPTSVQLTVPVSTSSRNAVNAWVVGTASAIGCMLVGNASSAHKTPDSGSSTNITPQANAAAPVPNRSTSPITNSEIAQPTINSVVAMGIKPNPNDHVWNEKNASAPSTITPTPITSLTIPNSATPATNSTSRSGVTMRLSRLRVQVSSSRPVLIAI